MNAVYVVAAIAIGLAMDWAIFERLKMTIGAVGAPADNHAYRDLLFPRVAVTVISSVIIALGMESVPERTIFVVAGGIAFMAANLYGVFAFLRGDLRR